MMNDLNISNQPEMQTKLPLNLKYGNKAESGLARQYQSRFQSDQKSEFYFGETIVFNIPTRPNQYLDSSNSYFKFAVSLKNGTGTTNSVILDSNGAHAFIDRIRVLHGSNVLEDSIDYALIAKIITDWHYSEDYKTNNMWVSGFNSNQNKPNLTINSGNVTDVSISKTNVGKYFMSSPTTSGQVSTKTFCLNLFSLVGSLSGDNYLPLTELVGAPLRVEITLKPSPEYCIASISALSTTSSDHKVSGTEFIASIIETSDDVNNAIRQANPNGFMISSVQYKMVQTDTKPLSSGSQNMVSTTIPARYRSVKSLFGLLRDSDKIGNTNYFSNSLNVMGVNSYQFRIGTQLYPQNPVVDNSVAFLEAQKAMNGGINDLFTYNNITEKTYTLNTPTQITTTNLNTSDAVSGCYAIGLDLESYTGIVNRSAMYSGTNLTSTDCNLNINSTGLTANMRVNIVALIDSLYTFSEGVAVVSV